MRRRSGNIEEKEENNMADQKKLVAEITSMDEDFTQWYTDVCTKAELVDYSNVN